KDEKVKNLAFSQKLDDLINNYIKFSEKKRKVDEFDQVPSLERKILFENQESVLQKQLDKISTEANFYRCYGQG
ncbi:hypothetical protein, partial [Chitinophaga sancti]|uniref:hypothetical protein n=1 Tax=Chitinophaga sancti TaxID=1004 RepID=UPI003F7B2F4C